MDTISEEALSGLVDRIDITPEQRNGLRSYLRKDNAWQQRARLRQVLWAQEHVQAPMHDTYPWKIATSDQSPYTGTNNFLTDAISARAELEITPGVRQEAGLINPDRLRTNLLSSQPLCFNAFGELSTGDGWTRATAVLRGLWPDLVQEVTNIRYEHNPHRGVDGVIGTGTAFDVFIDVVTPENEVGFIGIETKYHEGMDDKPPAREASTQDRTDRRTKSLTEAASLLNLSLDEVWDMNGWQMWMDHALAVAMLPSAVQAQHLGHDCFASYKRGKFVVLSPRGNTAVRDVYDAYRQRLTDAGTDLDTLDFCNLEAFVVACENAGEATWPGALRDRYLNMATVVGLLASP